VKEIVMRLGAESVERHECVPVILIPSDMMWFQDTPQDGVWVSVRYNCTSRSSNVVPDFVE
jgi:hypothetical protein